MTQPNRLKKDVMMTARKLTSSSLIGVEAGRGCKRVASALDITWLQTHGRKLLTVEKTNDVPNV